MKILPAGLLLLGLVSGAQAATLEQYASGTATPTTLGGFAMTDFDITNGVGGTTTSIGSPISGTLSFIDRYGASVTMGRRLASNNTSWWQNGEANDYDIFTTSLHLVTIMLPENTRAFSFNVGADLPVGGVNAWLSAEEFTGSGISKSWFAVNKANTPGFGVYVDKSSQGSCTSLASVTIDPLLWGFGNFSINQDSSCTTSVPESSSFYLFLAGLLGLLGFGLARRKS